MKHCSLTATQTAATSASGIILGFQRRKNTKGSGELWSHIILLHWKWKCYVQEEASDNSHSPTPNSCLNGAQWVKTAWRKYCIIQSCNKFLQAIFSSSVQPLAPLESFSALKIKIKFRNSKTKFSSFSKGLGEDYISFLHVQNKFPLFKSCSIDQSQRQVCFFSSSKHEHHLHDTKRFW